jgi:hypothetical protein
MLSGKARFLMGILHFSLNDMTVKLRHDIRLKFHIEHQLSRRHVIDVLPGAVIGESCHRLHEHLAFDTCDRFGDCDTIKADGESAPVCSACYSERVR